MNLYYIEFVWRVIKRVTIEFVTNLKVECDTKFKLLIYYWCWTQRQY
jgi:hypothetical protein